MDSVPVLVFWLGAVLVAYGYVGYPLIIYALGRLKGRPVARGDILPGVSLVVPAYNEAHVIKAKIDNCRQLDYPEDRLEVLIASDGSTDRTAELIQGAESGVITALVYPERRGKAAVINDLVRRASGAIVVFSDAASMLEPGSLRALASNFADPRVGCVSGVYRVAGSRRDADAGSENVYWRYETFVRGSEARLGTMLGAHGSLYAIRRDLFEPVDPGVINDDFVIPVTILLKGFRSIYDVRAVAREDAREMAGFARRVRIMVGNYQQLGLLLRRRDLWRRPRLLFQLLSHKGLRLIMPFVLASIYVSSACLLARPGYQLALVAQTFFFAAALLGLSPRARRLGGPFVAGPHYFGMVNAAALVGLYRFLRHRNGIAWKTGEAGRRRAAPAAVGEPSR